MRGAESTRRLPHVGPGRGGFESRPPPCRRQRSLDGRSSEALPHACGRSSSRVNGTRHNGRFTCEGRPRAGGMDDRSAGEIQIWRARLFSTDGSDVSWPGGRTEGVLVGPCHSRKSQRDMCKILHICLYNAPQVERTYKTITHGRTMQPWASGGL